MEKKLDVLETTRFSQLVDGKKPKSWAGERGYLARKTCPICGQEYHPRMEIRSDGSKKIVEDEATWNKSITCSRSCTMKWKNPWHNKDIVAKSVRKRAENKTNKIKNRGGNGHVTASQQKLCDVLGAGWEMEVIQKTKITEINGIPIPKHYKIDVGNKEKMIAIEVDGKSHRSSDRQDQDARKTKVLTQLGWKVLRLTNQESAVMCIISKYHDILPIMLEEF